MKQSDLEAAFLHWLGLLAPDLKERTVLEYTFAPPRKWRFDVAFVAEKLAIEIDGGQWAPMGGRHGADSDKIKLNQAAILGWRVLRFSGSMLKSDPAGCVEAVRAALGSLEAA